MKIDGVNYNLDKSATEILQTDVTSDKNSKIAKMFNIFDKNADGKLSKDEINNALDIFQSWNKADKHGNKDEELTLSEIKHGKNEIPEMKNFKKHDVKEFVKTLLFANQQTAIAEERAAKIEEDKKAEEAKKAEEDAKAKAKAEEEAKKAAEEKAKEKPETHDYVVPEGSTFKDLMKKVLLAQGKKEEELTEEDYKKAEEEFRTDNPNTKIRGDKTRYLLAGEKVKVRPDFKEELLDPATEEAKWKERVSKKNEQENVPSQKSADDLAKEKGLRPTHRSDFYYDDKEKMHYRYKDGKFIKYENIKYMAPDGSYIREYKNGDGSNRYIFYGKDGYPTKMQGRNSQDKLYTNPKNQALRETLDRTGQNIYYDPKTKMHYQWDDEKHEFRALDRKEVRYISPDGTFSKSHPKQITRTASGNIIEKWSDEEEYTYDKNGKIIKQPEEK